MSDPGVQFVSGLSDVNAILGENAEIMCKVSSEDCEGAWFKDNQKVSPKPQTNNKLISLFILILSGKEQHANDIC